MNRKCVLRLMPVMGIEVIYLGPNLSKRYHAQYIRPYLLAPSAWTAEIKSGESTLRICGWAKASCICLQSTTGTAAKSSITNSPAHWEKAFVLTCLKRTLGRCQPEIIKSDQGSHFTNPDYLDLLAQHDVKVSMDGKGRARDNSRTERFFRSLKYEEIYLNEYENPRTLCKATTAYLCFYHTEHPHHVLGYTNPDEVYARNT